MVLWSPRSNLPNNEAEHVVNYIEGAVRRNTTPSLASSREQISVLMGYRLSKKLHQGRKVLIIAVRRCVIESARKRREDRGPVKQAHSS